ncbi:adenosylcobinamide-GDP ribazoletransferase [Mucilaginibacter sp. FT3.2]|uniref:adenosylcobinamide-GDP ribazoletransferase n=1 Tax=Mucilaginibacter sp. FT3.2 TaxID=2723090 RepID=UPI00160C8460|nr:adenosylcobinamide-GDP ribazoletransferase [Mucilaginibacter sp. FT3.2]MBB6232912.1 adenosylcobinamide-GDP ribazoletransferase [Mucilaginibacter sp. FT3.2]
MKEEIRIFFTALMFYTRIPCPKNIDHSADYLNKATRYFPLIGWIVGSISFLVFWLSSFLFDINISVVLSLISGVLVTGAFHEDGLADVFDGFGGGWTKAKILDIMKDSRVGAYGVIALIFLFAFKLYALDNLLSKINTHHCFLIALLFITYHSLSRLTAINICFTSQYSRENEDSKAKPIAKENTYKEIGGAYFFGLLPLLILCFLQWQYCLVLIPLALLYVYSRYYFNKWIDGYTGDCLGAVEQIAECVCMLTFLVLWKYI